MEGDLNLAETFRRIHILPVISYMEDYQFAKKQRERLTGNYVLCSTSNPIVSGTGRAAKVWTVHILCLCLSSESTLCNWSGLGSFFLY